MKKIIIGLMATLLLTGCSSNGSNKNKEEVLNNKIEVIDLDKAGYEKQVFADEFYNGFICQEGVFPERSSSARQYEVFTKDGEVVGVRETTKTDLYQLIEISKELSGIEYTLDEKIRDNKQQYEFRTEHLRKYESISCDVSVNEGCAIETTTYDLLSLQKELGKEYDKFVKNDDLLKVGYNEEAKKLDTNTLIDGLKENAGIYEE